MSKTFINQLGNSLRSTASSYYKKVEGDHASAMRRADSITAAISQLRRYKASYSRRTSSGGRESDQRMMKYFQDKQDKSSEEYSKWLDKTSGPVVDKIIDNNDIDKAVRMAVEKSTIENIIEGRAKFTEFTSLLDYPSSLKQKTLTEEQKAKGAFGYKYFEELIDENEKITPERKQQLKEDLIKSYEDRYQSLDGAQSFKEFVDKRYVSGEKSEARQLAEQLVKDSSSPEGLANIRQYYNEEAEDPPRVTDFRDDVDFFRIKSGLAPRYNRSLKAPSSPPPDSATDEEKTKFIKSQFPFLRVENGQVVTHPDLTPQDEKIANDFLQARNISLPQNYGSMVRSPELVAESFNISTTTNDIQAEIERLEKSRDSILEEASKKGGVTQGQLMLLSHPFLPSPGLRTALPVSIPFSERFKLVAEPVEPPDLGVEDINFQHSSPVVSLTDEEIMASDPSDPDDFEPDLTIREPDDRSDFKSAGLPGVKVIPAIVRRLESGLDEESVESPKDLASDFTLLPDSVKSRFPIAFVNAINEVATMDTKGGDQIEIQRQKLREAMEFKESILDDEIRVADFVLELRGEPFPSEKTNQATNLMEFLNHESALATTDDGMPTSPTSEGPQGLSLAILGESGVSLLNLSREATEKMMQDDDAFFDTNMSEDFDNELALTIQSAEESIGGITGGDTLGGVRMASMDAIKEASEGLGVRPQQTPTGFAARGPVGDSGGNIGTVDVPLLTGDDKELASALANLGEKTAGVLPGETPKTGVPPAPPSIAEKRTSPTPPNEESPKDIQFRDSTDQIAVEEPDPSQIAFSDSSEKIKVEETNINDIPEENKTAYLSLYGDILDRIQAIKNQTGKNPGKQIYEQANSQLSKMASGLGIPTSVARELEFEFDKRATTSQIPQAGM